MTPDTTPPGTYSLDNGYQTMQTRFESNDPPETQPALSTRSADILLEPPLGSEKVAVPPASSPGGKPPLDRDRSIDEEGSPPLQRWFNNLPIRQKQINASLLSQILSIAAVTGVGAALLYTSGRKQLVNQSQSELAVTGIGYMIKVNQMGFGFRGQSDNPAIINAARFADTNQPLPPELRAQVKKILKNEVKARKMEYATLVDRRGRIVVGANAERTGQIFTPRNFIQQVIDDPRQLKVTAVVPLSELQTEKPPLPEGLKPVDALIRYTFTPVRDNQRVIGVLISGDIVNGKTPIVEQAINSFGTGYSGIYYRDLQGNLTLASSLYSRVQGNPSQAGIAIPDRELLKAALENPGKPVTQQMNIEGQNYTVSARTFPNVFQEQSQGPVRISGDTPIAVLVRGTPQIALNSILRDSLGVQLLVALGALALSTALANLLGNAIARPIERLQKTALRFGRGDQNARAEITSTDEIGQLGRSFNQLADNIVENENRRELEARRKQLLADVASAREAALLTDPLNQLLTEVRGELRADRVVIYRFTADGNGYLVAESVADGLPSALSAELVDNCIGESLKKQYSQGRVLVMDNVLEHELHPEHRQLLNSIGVKSSIIVPIVQTEELFGWAIAHHCHTLHAWSEAEKATLQEFARTLAGALPGIALLEQRELEALRSREQNQILQGELFKLLSDVEGAAGGDLTVRAEITAGEIGIVADFFNAIIESLRELVTRVKETATRVNGSVRDSSGAIRLLANEAIDQANQIGETLNSVEQMNRSIQAVAQNAQIAARISRQASENATTGGEAMEKTVDSIVQLRSTIAETAKKVKRLGESSQQISRVIALINQIAMKTNLLAVNASIEAARAGEEGRGFAVVAEEVGELAAQSATATKEIEGIVEAIQRETNEVVQAMEVGTSQVVEGTRLVEQTKTSLQQIVEVSKSIDELLQSISTATVSQTESSRRVAILMETIARISEKTSHTSEQVSRDLEDTVSIAQDLQTSVETFKVEG
ncbi:methyl-accepting chemotaxis protein [Pannus brasiliensis CCIBt3594]|uniref:Methyl-accepting chemotaxis protein n=1 Tax=Pannus brasiliensis CCIBt3594 TaxID=1427578 RepID=A0AAW9QRV8_9CHRO